MPATLKIQDLESMALTALDLFAPPNFTMPDCEGDLCGDPCGDVDSCDGDCGCDEIV